MRTNLFEGLDRSIKPAVSNSSVHGEVTETLSKVAVAKVELLLLHTTSPMYTL